jgi:GNAT superfamily N-acetyltransferase
MGLVTIRPARLEDTNSITGLLAQLGYPQEPDALRERLELWLRDERGGRVHVAEVDGSVVGFIALHVCPHFARPGNRGRITAMAVDERHRRREIGKELVVAAQRVAAELGCVDMEVTSSRRRDDAHAFYAALGYGEVSARSGRFVRSLP